MIAPVIREPMSTVVSMIHIALMEEKPGLLPNVFRIAPGTMEKPSVTHIGAARHHVYLDDTRGSLPIKDASYEVARSIVEDYSTSQVCISEGVFPGIFWVPGKLTFEEIQDEYPDILRDAKIGHKRWMEALLKLADDDFARYAKHNVVSDFQRRLAEICKLDPKKHPWMNVANSLEQLSCPGCGNAYMPGIEICGSCKRVLNKESYDPANYATV